MREILTSLAYKRLSAIIFVAGIPFAWGVPGELMFLVGWLAQLQSPAELPARLIKGIRSLPIRARDSRLVLVMNLLALWMVFTSFFALSVSTALASSLMAILVAWMCFTIIVPYMLSDKQMHTPLIATFVLSTTLVCILAVIRHCISDRGPLQRAAFLSMGPNSLGNVVAMSLLASILLVTRVKPRWRPAIAVTVFIQLTTLAFTYSRGSWLAMAAGILVLILCTRSKPIIAIAIAVTIVFAVFAGTNPSLVQRIQSIVSLESNSDRIELFQAGAKMIQDRPLTGFGVNNIGFAYEAYRQPRSRFGDRVPFLHNIFIEFGATTGILGLLLITAIIVGLLYIGTRSALSRKAPLYACIAFAMLVAQIVHLQVDIIIFAATTMPLVFIPAGVLLRYYGSLTRGSQASECSADAVDS